MKNSKNKMNYGTISAIALSIALLLSGGTGLAMHVPAGINARDEFGRTGLIWAAAGGDKAQVEKLISEGADLNVRDSIAGQTALMLAAALPNNEEIVKLLLYAGADPNIKSDAGKTALNYADYGMKKYMEGILEEIGLR